MSECNIVPLAQSDHPGYFAGCLTHDRSPLVPGTDHCEAAA